jgi:hypothetical protein
MTMKNRCAGRRPIRPAAGLRRWGVGTLPAAGVAVALLLSGVSGCQKFAAAFANISGGDWIDAEYKLGHGPLLILIDDRDGRISEPKALVELHKTLCENFVEFNVNKSVVPLQEWRRLAQNDRGYSKLNIRQVGEKLGAEQVLYLFVEKFSLNTEVGAPVYKGEFSVRVKVISTDRKHDVRLWPPDDAGRRVTSTTTPIATDSEKSASDIATELAIKLGQEVAKLFYGRRELVK